MTLSHVQAAQALHARRFRPLQTIKDKTAGPGRRDSTGPPSPPKAVRKQQAAAKPDQAKPDQAKPVKANKDKSRPGDVVIDLVTEVWTSTVIPGASSPQKEVSKLPKISAKHAK